MMRYLIVCNSLTKAQRTERALARAGIPSRVGRAPKEAETAGCSYAVQIGERHLSSALVTLAKADLTPRRVFLQTGDGYREVEL